MACGSEGSEFQVPLAHNVPFSLGSEWSEIPTDPKVKQGTYNIMDDTQVPPKNLTTVHVTPPGDFTVN
jgi:hypothetical protein